MRAHSAWLGLALGLAIGLSVLAGLGRLQAPAQRSDPPALPQQTESSSGAEHKEMTNAGAEAKWRELTPEEARVIVEKSTERPFTGKYYDHFAKGIYTCRRCGAMLYRSDDKFRSDCGWPAFDDEIPGAVKRVPDADAVRTEIVCANCGAHLGHVFLGEGLTKKDTRHCVNSVSLQFIPADQAKFGRAIFAAGCFWGVEYWFQQQPGVLDTTVGYTGGHTEHPTYESIHAKGTGHAEAVEVLYDPVRVSYEQLAKRFFEIHNPEQRDGQGPDLGSEYRSAIFYLDDGQKQVAEKLIAELKARGMNIATEVAPAGRFWPAEEYHQDWYRQKGSTPACHNRKPLWPSTSPQRPAGEAARNAEP
jgi:peptide methionine sulfoxide reductase msrA/msrB